MKDILILSCGPGLDDVRNEYGHAIEWIQRGVNSSEIKFTSMDVYKGEIPNYDDGDAWIISGSSASVYDDFDWIVVLDKGSVVGQGKHDELMKNCPLYGEMWELEGQITAGSDTNRKT